MATSLGEPSPGVDGRAERFWNLPNTITVGRTAVVPMIMAFPLFDTPGGSVLMAWTFIVAAVGDLVDGWLARRGNTVTKIGKLLDPLADKLIVSTALIMLLAVGRLPEWSFPLVIVIIGRELAVTGLRGIAVAGGQVMEARPGGKLKTVAQNVAIGALIFPQGTLGLPNHQIGLYLLGAAAALTLWSGWVYFADYFRAERAQGPKP